MVVVTPYAPDLELFSGLHQSVMRWSPADVRHVAVVNQPDLPLFRRFEGPRCQIIRVRDALPASVVALPFTKLWLNVAAHYRPFEAGSSSSS